MSADALDKSATVSDIRCNGELRWSSILKCKSLETFLKFGRHSSRSGSMKYPISERVEWIRREDCWKLLPQVFCERRIQGAERPDVANGAFCQKKKKDEAVARIRRSYLSPTATVC
ncbi:hypothetical protein RB195_025062 [Necator americanus]|uniref:Uncharacterized protein n=1 Tax=Necator americanus TaxID=51031 RepID=A0ABR1EQQ7_NECAM